MAVGGLMAEVFKLFLGNPDILTTLVTIAVCSTLLLTVIEISKDTEL